MQWNLIRPVLALCVLLCFDRESFDELCPSRSPTMAGTKKSEQPNRLFRLRLSESPLSERLLDEHFTFLTRQKLLFAEMPRPYFFKKMH